MFIVKFCLFNRALFLTLSPPVLTMVGGGVYELLQPCCQLKPVCLCSPLVYLLLYLNPLFLQVNTSGYICNLIMNASLAISGDDFHHSKIADSLTAPKPPHTTPLSVILEQHVIMFYSLHNSSFDSSAGCKVNHRSLWCKETFNTYGRSLQCNMLPGSGMWVEFSLPHSSTGTSNNIGNKKWCCF